MRPPLRWEIGLWLLLLAAAMVGAGMGLGLRTGDPSGVAGRRTAAVPGWEQEAPAPQRRQATAPWWLQIAGRRPPLAAAQASAAPRLVPLPRGWQEARRAMVMAPAGLRSELVARWIAHLRKEGTPLREGDRLYFFYFGEASRVAVSSDATGWQPLDLVRVPGTKLWAGALRLPPDAVVAYRLLVDGRGQPDPLNARRSKALGVEWSVYLGPTAPGREPPADVVPAGRWHTWTLSSRHLQRRVEIRGFVPAACRSARPCSALIAADGPFYLGEGELPAIAGYLTQEGAIPPLVLVGIRPPQVPVQRVLELLPGFRGGLWRRFVAEELLPDLQRRLPVHSGPHGLLGLSAGAAAMLEVLLTYPSHFSWAIVQSPAGVPPVLEQAVAQVADPSARVWITWGSYETNIFGIDLRAYATGLQRRLRERGFAVAGGERPAGHTMAAWRRDLPAALTWALEGAGRTPGMPEGERRRR